MVYEGLSPGYIHRVLQLINLPEHAIKVVYVRVYAHHPENLVQTEHLEVPDTNNQIPVAENNADHFRE